MYGCPRASDDQLPTNRGFPGRSSFLTLRVQRVAPHPMVDVATDTLSRVLADHTLEARFSYVVATMPCLIAYFTRSAFVSRPKLFMMPYL